MNRLVGKKSIGAQGDKHVAHRAQKGVHHHSDEEREAFVGYINASLGADSDLADVMPISMEADALFKACTPGVLLCKMVNNAVPGTVDERVINKVKGGKSIGVFQAIENHNLAIGSAQAIGCTVVNIGAQDLNSGTPHITLGLIWQIIRIGLLQNVTLTAHPELYRLLLDGESLDDLMKLSPEAILLRWVNYHLANAGSEKRIKNFGKDIADSEAYTVLLNQLNKSCDTSALKEGDLEKRAGMVLSNADKLAQDGSTFEWCKFLKPRDIVNGNTKLNLAFVANLFNTCPGLDALDEEQQAEMGDDWLFSGEGSREARAFAMWLNSLGIDPYVNNLFQDLRDGLVLLRAEDAIEPGSVPWKKVKEGRMNNFQKIGNCGVAVDTALAIPFKFSLVGIQGADINAGNKKLTLAIVWQLMRHHVISLLKTVSDVQTIRGKNFKPIEEKDLIAWANKKTSLNKKETSMKNFQDSSLKTGLFFIDLLSAIRPKAVNYEFVNDGSTEELAMDNAKYAISVARKMGAVIFLLPEDIVEVKPKMILTFCAALMAVDRRGG